MHSHTGNTDSAAGPHAGLAHDNPRQQFAARLFDRLWHRYQSRVSYVQTYTRVIAQAGATFFNDHIAFRTLAGQTPQAGIAHISRIFEALGYVAAGCYHFPDKHLGAIHYQHENRQFPKIFISELQVWQLSTETRRALRPSLERVRPALDIEILARLAHLDSLPVEEQDELLLILDHYFRQLPWPLPQRDDVVQVHRESQYGAWVLVHGFDVNHFTSLINSHAVPALDSIEKTIAALRAAGVPMKAEIEGAPGSILRQSATEAVNTEVSVSSGTEEMRIPWTYAYFELAERGTVVNPQTNEPERFEGFLGPQATQLFEMTRPR